MADELVPPVGGIETILLVEDDAGVRGVTCRMLERGGFTVLTAPDGDTAVSLASRHPDTIALLLADMILPGLPIEHLVMQVRRIAPRVRVLLMSGYPDAMQEGAPALAEASFIAKPMTLAALARKVREVLDAE